MRDMNMLAARMRKAGADEARITASGKITAKKRVPAVDYAKQLAEFCDQMEEVLWKDQVGDVAGDSDSIREGDDFELIFRAKIGY